MNPIKSSIPEFRCGELNEEGMDEVEPRPLVVTVAVVVGVVVRSNCDEDVDAGESTRFSSDRV